MSGGVEGDCSTLSTGKDTDLNSAHGLLGPLSWTPPYFSFYRQYPEKRPKSPKAIDKDRVLCQLVFFPLRFLIQPEL